MMHSSAAPAAKDDSAKEQREIVEIYGKLRGAEAKLVGPEGQPEPLPNNLYSFLLRLLAELRAGHAVTILQSRHELTTIQAGKVLGISRQYLIKLLEKGELPFHLVGTHRRIYARDVTAYKAKRDSARRTTLNELAGREFARGGYGEIPNDFHDGR